MSDNTVIATGLLADALGVSASSVGPDTRIGAVPEWDSMAHMRLILGIEKALGQSLPAQAVLNIASYEDVVASLG